MLAGNIAKCNYIFNGDHCMYVDNLSSEVKITGGACINAWDGMKINNGQRYDPSKAWQGSDMRNTHQVTKSYTHSNSIASA